MNKPTRKPQKRGSKAGGVETPPANKKPVAGRKRSPVARPAIEEGYNLGNDKTVIPNNADPLEMRACCLWEYARESVELIELVDRIATGRKPGDSNKNLTDEQYETRKLEALDRLRAINPGLGLMVAYAWDCADLRKPWIDYPEGLRRGMMRNLQTQARVASQPETMRACKEMSLGKPRFSTAEFLLLNENPNDKGNNLSGQSVKNWRQGDLFLYGHASTETVIAFTVDAGKSAKALAAEIKKLLPGCFKAKGKGRGGNMGNSFYGKALDALRVFRAASIRDNATVLKMRCGVGSDAGIRGRKMEACRFFVKFFPRLEKGMLSERAWEKRPREKRGKRR
jgi:hypothetical protein